MDRAKEKLTALLALWEQKRGIRPVPSRDDFPVGELRPWLGNLALIDLTGDAPRFRLCGTSLHVRFGGEMTKRTVAALEVGLGGPELLACIEEARQTLMPATLTQRIAGDPKQIVFHELCLPLGQDGRFADTILFVSFSERRR
jgi:hypothetical protein